MDRCPECQYSSTPIPASSVPYFGPTCGDRFVTVDQFDAAFDRFWANREAYRPRAYVVESLSLEGSGRLYLQHLARAASLA